MRFNKLLFFSIMLTGVFLWACSDSHAGQLEEGKAAFDRQEYQKAYALLLPPAEGGDTYAQISIGYMLSQGLGVSKNEREAIRWYEKAALKGDSDAQYNIGSMYETGRGTKQDFKKAMEWYSKSAEQGNKFAQEKLASFYYNGNGIDVDYQKAVYWYTKSAEQGYSQAQNSLGVIYVNGNGVKKDLDKGYEWILKAAKQGLEVAQENAYAICYDAAKSENIGAMHNLAYMCLNGWAGKQNPGTCISILEMAGEKGFAPSVSALAKIYKEGLYGITVDQKKAMYWGEKSKKIVNK